MQIVRLSLLGAVLFSCLPTIAQDSPMFRGNLAHTGVYNAPGVPKFSKIKWKFQTGGQVISSPAVANGAAYIASTDGNLYALDLESGVQKWKLALGVRATASPAVDNGVIYLGTYSGRFYAVDAATGKLKWKFQTEGERRFAGKHLHGSEPAGETMPDPFDCYLSSPAVWNGAVYFGGGDGNVYALDATTGTLKWKFHTGDVVHASPAIADGTYLSGAGIAISTLSMPPPEKRNGDSRPEKITIFTTRSASSLQPRSPKARCTSAAVIPTFMRSMPSPGRRNGLSTTRARG